MFKEFDIYNMSGLDIFQLYTLLQKCITVNNHQISGKSLCVLCELLLYYDRFNDQVVNFGDFIKIYEKINTIYIDYLKFFNQKTIKQNKYNNKPDSSSVGDDSDDSDYSDDSYSGEDASDSYNNRNIENMLDILLKEYKIESLKLFILEVFLNKNVKKITFDIYLRIVSIIELSKNFLIGFEQNNQNDSVGKQENEIYLQIITEKILINF